MTLSEIASRQRQSTCHCPRFRSAINVCRAYRHGHHHITSPSPYTCTSVPSILLLKRLDMDVPHPPYTKDGKFLKKCAFCQGRPHTSVGCRHRQLELRLSHSVPRFLVCASRWTYVADSRYAHQAVASCLIRSLSATMTLALHASPRMGSSSHLALAASRLLFFCRSRMPKRTGRQHGMAASACSRPTHPDARGRGTHLEYLDVRVVGADGECFDAGTSDAG